MLLEIALNAGSVVLEGARGIRLPVATGRRLATRHGRAPRVRARMLAHFMVHLYIAVVCSYGKALADRIVLIVSYRIVSRDFV